MLDQDATNGNDPETVVISAALTGARTTRDQCKHIPYTPEENVRVGLEDNFYLPEGRMGTNAELVEKAAEFARDVGRDPASPDEACEILDVA